MYDFRGRVAVVTGAGGEIGRAIVRKFCENGACAALLDIREEELRKAAEDPGTEEDRLLCIQTDISDEASVQAAVRAVRDRFGRIDYLCNAAGIEGPSDSRTELYDTDAARRVFDVNIFGTFLMMKHILPIMQEQKSGAIVNFGSISGMYGYEGEIAYGASKAAVIQMSRTVANENIRLGIRCNTISPSWVDTGMFHRVVDQYSAGEGRDSGWDNVPLGNIGRIAEPAEIANAAVFLCSEEASFVNGVNLVCDGGMTLDQKSPVQ